MTVALVLAAGGAERFGEQKLLAGYRGAPLIRRVVENALASSAAEVLVVLGNDAGRVEEALDGLGVATVRNPDPRRGMSSSIRVGVAAVREEAESVLVVLGDQPGVAPGLMDRILAADPDREAEIVAPLYRNGLGNPVLFRSSVFDELAALTGDRGARRVVERDPHRVERVPVDRAIPSDVDTPEDLERLRARTPRSDELDG